MKVLSVFFVPPGSDLIHDGEVVRRGHGWVYVRQHHGKRPGRISAVRQKNIDACMKIFRHA